MITISRRDILNSTIGVAALMGASGCQILARKEYTRTPILSATTFPDGRHCVQAASPDGTLLWRRSVANRCHGGCHHPGGHESVVFERRPGWRFHVYNPFTGAEKHTIESTPGEHFYGHGVFSPTGDRLYATASRFESGEGIVAVYEVRGGYKRVDTLALPGIGPHELKLHPDGNTLVIALGGIRTHPDYDRIKLNLADMDPALLFIDRHSGKLLARFRPSHHQLSCRHLDVDEQGNVYVGYQFQGPDHERPPLIGRYRAGHYDEIRFVDDVQNRFKNYIASVAVDPLSGVVAATAPRGNVTVLFDSSSGAVINTMTIGDCAGLKWQTDPGLTISTGSGALITLPSPKATPVALAKSSFQWDNHLI